MVNETDPLWMITLKRDGDARESFLEWVRTRKANHGTQVISAVQKEDYMGAQRHVGASDELAIVESLFLAWEKEIARVKG